MSELWGGFLIMKISGVLISPSYKFGTFSRAASADTADISYSGLGGTPKFVFFLSAISGQQQACIGIDKSDERVGLYNSDMAVNESWTRSANVSIVAHFGASGYQTGKIKTLDVDGFTITWTKSGTPTGMIDVTYLAIF